MCLLLLCFSLFAVINDNSAKGIPVANDNAMDSSSLGSGRIELFAQLDGRTLAYKLWNGTSWGNWSSLGGTLTSAPAAVYSGANKTDVFARASIMAFGKYHGMEQTGAIGTVSEDNYRQTPAASSSGNGDITVFARAKDGTLAYKLWNGTNWGNWSSLGGTLTSAPASRLFRCK